jgi:predicted TIM-barrel fold metal-dependent hydrolase
MIVDTNVSLGLWPFRRIPGDTAVELIARLKKRGVTQAWAGSFEGLFHRDLTSVNARLAKACQTAGGGFLLPFGSVNPKSPGWHEDLRLCHEVHKMRGVRLHPNYHGYLLSDGAFRDVLREASNRKLIVQLVLNVEDERTQHPLMRVPPVDPGPLAKVALADLRLIVLNRMRNPAGQALAELARAGEVYFDIAMIEGAGCAGELMSVISEKRMVFGSHSPFQYFESALLKIEESAITGEQRSAILTGNAQRLLKP